MQSSSWIRPSQSKAVRFTDGSPQSMDCGERPWTVNDALSASDLDWIKRGGTSHVRDRSLTPRTADAN